MYNENTSYNNQALIGEILDNNNFYYNSMDEAWKCKNKNRDVALEKMKKTNLEIRPFGLTMVENGNTGTFTIWSR